MLCTAMHNYVSYSWLYRSTPVYGLAVMIVIAALIELARRLIVIAERCNLLVYARVAISTILALL